MAFEALVLTVVAVSLIGLATMHFVSDAISICRAATNARSRMRVDVKGLRQAAGIARLNSDLQSTTAAGSTMHWRVMEVAEIIDDSVDCRSFYLVDPYRQPLPDFRPGQHLMVRPALAGAYQTTRCYSLSSPPDSRYWRITVKRQASGNIGSRHQRCGQLSSWLHDRIGVGECLLIGGPNGQFYLAVDNPRPLVLVAAGIGITPMASMLRWSQEHTPERSVKLLYQAKDSDNWPLGESLHRYQAKFPNCQVKTYFSRMKEKDLVNARAEIPGELLTGRFDHNDVRNAPPNDPSDYFLCGPNGWMEAIRCGLIAVGVAPDRIHWESFGLIGDSKTPAKDESGHAVAVRFDHSKVDAHWQDPEQSLWELARQHRIEIPSGCLSGVCGCCRVKLLSGEVEYDREISLELAKDECLTCVARPKTALCVDA